MVAKEVKEKLLDSGANISIVSSLAHLDKNLKGLIMCYANLPVVVYYQLVNSHDVEKTL